MPTKIASSRRQTVVIPAIVLFVLGTAVTVLFWQLLPDGLRGNESSDFDRFYDPVARQIVAGDGLTLPDGTIATRYPPGFPAIIAASYATADMLRFTQSTALDLLALLCVGVSAVFVFLLACDLWGTGWGIVGGLAWLTYPFALWISKQPNSELPFIPLLLASLWALWWGISRPHHTKIVLFLAGVLIGLAMLVRPVAIGLGVLMALGVLVLASSKPRRTRLLLAGLLLLGNLLVIAPWEAWVYAETGEIIPVGTGSKLTIRDGITYFAMPKEYRQGVPLPADAETLAQVLYERADEMASVGAIGAVVWEESRLAPAAAVKLALIKAARAWYATDSNRLESATLVLQAGYLLLALMGTWIAWRMKRKQRPLLLIIWVAVLYFWGMTVLVVPLLRYMLPIMGLLMVTVPGVGVWLLEQLAIQRQRGTGRAGHFFGRVQSELQE